MKHMKFLLLAGTVMTLGFANHAQAETQIPPDAVKIDTQTQVTTDKQYNNQGEIVATTKTTTTTDYYEFDTNQNELLDPEEYVVYSYEVIDHNKDGKVNNKEWNDYTTIWYEPVDVHRDPETSTFVAYDIDGDGYIDMTEYKNAYDVDLYNAWDKDKSGALDMNEYKSMSTTYHDLDKDGYYEWVTIN